MRQKGTNDYVVALKSKRYLLMAIAMIPFMIFFGYQSTLPTRYPAAQTIGVMIIVLWDAILLYCLYTYFPLPRILITLRENSFRLYIRKEIIEVPFDTIEEIKGICDRGRYGDDLKNGKIQIKTIDKKYVIEQVEDLMAIVEEMKQIMSGEKIIERYVAPKNEKDGW